MLKDISEIENIYEGFDKEVEPILKKVDEAKIAKDEEAYDALKEEYRTVWRKYVNTFLEKLDTSLDKLSDLLAEAIKTKAEEVTKDMVNIICHNDYGRVLEDPAKMTAFLVDEASKPEVWKCSDIEATEQELVKITFKCKIVDEGDNFIGVIFLSKSGMLRHIFFQDTGL